ncbi:helix-turn-helix domain-containing protein [Terasakiella sp. A23]|uniref:helix-turn-helix domain-containing protein n=1 Tax=Terasakiella sp. FCG-A23 TaxID=3080561 RepID=UPI0029540FF8|nr:helix-turn-helix domain-containing protein [Terasakiella sp. A23]MDV7341010.1 helix-turn-helix domain-containing protein [Terasakiella sp. A23]
MTREPAKGLHKEEIKAKIRMTGWTMVGLSRHWGFHWTAINTCLRNPWPTVEAKIAKLIKMEPQEIWPDRYDQDGNPLKDQHVGKQNIKKKARHNDQFTKAA